MISPRLEAVGDLNCCEEAVPRRSKTYRSDYMIARKRHSIPTKAAIEDRRIQAALCWILVVM